MNFYQNKEEEKVTHLSLRRNKCLCFFVECLRSIINKFVQGKHIDVQTEKRVPAC